MSRRRSLLTLHAMLEFVAEEASKGGNALASSLAAAAAEAILEQISGGTKPINGTVAPLDGHRAVPKEISAQSPQTRPRPFHGKRKRLFTPRAARSPTTGDGRVARA